MKETSWPVTRPDTLLPFLLAHGTGYSRNNIKSLLTGGKVLVDGRRATRHDHPLAPGQTVSLAPRQRQTASLPFPILYEDKELLAVDKPAGLLSMANEKERTQTAYHMVTDYVRESEGGRVFIVHRLDQDTSGVLLFAKNEKAKRAFQDNWEALVQRRGYLALVEGAPPEEIGTLRSYLRETTTHLVYSVPHGGKEAVTRYRTLRRGQGYTLLDVEIDTGRKNQIRVQLADLGCPVAGDKKYGATTSPLKRLCLHAGVLSLQNPLSEGVLELIAPPPEGFYKLCGGRGTAK